MNEFEATEQAFKNGYKAGLGDGGNGKRVCQISTIQRALGMIEGVSYGMEQSAGQALADAVQMIEETIKEMLEDG